MPLKQLTDYMIQAFIDGELPPEEAKRVQANITKDKQAQKRYDELIHQRHLLLDWWKNMKKNH